MSAPHTPGDITQLLRAHHEGDRDAFDRLVPLVYDRMRRIARGQLARSGRGHTLSPTALVHEAYQQLVAETGVDWQDRSHFYGICARAMRRILVDYARMRRARKRGGALPHITPDRDGEIGDVGSPAEVILAVDRTGAPDHVLCVQIQTDVHAVDERHRCRDRGNREQNPAIQEGERQGSVRLFAQSVRERWLYGEAANERIDALESVDRPRQRCASSHRQPGSRVIRPTFEISELSQ